MGTWLHLKTKTKRLKYQNGWQRITLTCTGVAVAAFLVCLQDFTRHPVMCAVIGRGALDPDAWLHTRCSTSGSSCNDTSEGCAGDPMTLRCERGFNLR